MKEITSYQRKLVQLLNLHVTSFSTTSIYDIYLLFIVSARFLSVTYHDKITIVFNSFSQLDHSHKIAVYLPISQTIILRSKM